MTDAKPDVTAIAWFTAESWPKLLAVTDDRPTLPDTFSEFERIAGGKFNRFVAASARLDKVLIDVDAYHRWCRRNGIRMDMVSRATFAAATLRQREVPSEPMPDLRPEDMDPRR